MTIETANRLVEYRKKHNLSQEDVAEKIGVSRQAVSKWERAEASPDTDNLMALARLYQISLDELILGNEPEGDAEPGSESEPEAPGKVIVTKGKKTVVLEGPAANGHLHIHVEDGEAEDDEEEDEEHSGGFRAEGTLEIDPAESSFHKFFRVFPFPVLTLIAYLIFGFAGVCGGWAWGWLVFLLVPLYYTLVEAVFCRNATIFAFPVLVTLVYCWLGLDFGLWHPMWILFLTVPVYYCITEFLPGKKKGK